MSNKITIEVKLSDEDRALLRAAAGGSKAVVADTVTEEETTTDDDTGGGDTDDAGDDDFDTAGATEVTKADVQTAMREYAEATSKADAMKLMKAKGGSEALSTLKPEKYEAVITACKAATKKAKAKAK